MKKKWLKKLVALSTAALMMLGTVSVMAAEEGAGGEVTPPASSTKPIDASQVSIADDAYYQKVLNGSTATTSTITVTKKTSTVDGAGFENDSKGIKGVDFKIKKIGNLVQIEDGKDTVMAYSVEADLAKLISLTGDYECGDSIYVRDYKEINEALKQMRNDEVLDYVENMQLQKTNTNGVANFGAQEFGLYLVVETSVAEASVDGEYITITKKQYPFVISAPYYNGSNWVKDVNANAKNETGTESLEKEIVRSYEDEVGPFEDEDLKDTDVTEVGDVVEFKLTATLPDMTDSAKSAKIDSFVLQDNISNGLTLPGTFSDSNLKVVDASKVAYILGETNDYTIEHKITTNGNSITGTDGFIITFTENGLKKLTDLAKNKTVKDRELYVYYTATVNENAVVGETGNPNEARLEYSAGGSHTIITDWDEVTEYIFNIKADKTFDEKTDADKAKEVKFKLFMKNGENRVYQYVTGSNGEYTYNKQGSSEDKEGSTLSLSTKGGTLTIKGAPTNVDLYLEEIATAPGYNLLKDPVKLVLVPTKDNDTDEHKGTDEYDGTLSADSTVNGQTATLTKTEDGIEFTVNNTSGFQLPATGGMGAWIFAIVGVFVIAAGVVFYVATRRKKA